MKGDIGIFSVAEILQMIGMQEKTGVLTVKSKGKSAILLFESGKVVSARDRRQGAKDKFLFYLEEKGVIDPHELQKVAEARQNDGGDLVEILLNEKIISETELAKMLSQYASDTLETVVKWETGTFEFAAGANSLPEKSLVKPLRLEPILMEALRRKDEVEEIRRFLPSYDTRIRLSVSNAAELPLEEQDSTVLGLVNGKRTIDEIVDESDADEIETLDILERLFALGIVAIAEQEEQKSGHPPVVPVFRSLILSAVAVLVAVTLRFTWLAPKSPEDLPLNRLRSSIEQFIDGREIQNLHFALEAHKAIVGTYPARLDELVTAGLITADQARNGHGDDYSYTYVAREGSYVLSR